MNIFGKNIKNEIGSLSKNVGCEKQFLNRLRQTKRVDT